MPKLVFSAEEIKEFVSGRRYGAYKHRCEELAEKLAIHADGCYPQKLIENRRPNEPLEVQQYREKIWIPKTEPTFTKVYNSLQKIRRSSEWIPKYKDLDSFTRVPEGEDLETYCEKEFPFFTSMTNWVFQAVLRPYLIDANGGVLVIPINQPAEGELERPFPIIFRSCDILEYAEEDYVVLVDYDGCKYWKNRGTEYVTGKTYYFVTTQNIFRYDQTNDRGDYKLVRDYAHQLGVLPFVKWKGMLVDYNTFCAVYKSRIAGMVPELDEAVREYSDLQAAKVMHMYPERWEFSQHECTTCKGTGLRRNPAFVEGGTAPCDVNCDRCVNGYTVAGPYSKILVRPAVGNEVASSQNIPMPPAGFIEKDVEIIRIQEESINHHLYSALAAINFEFLVAAPTDQSGIAKAEDRDEAGNTTHSIAEDIVAFMDSVYYLTAKYRYMVQYPDDDDIRRMLPSVPVPEKFDLVTSTDIASSLKLAKDSKANPVILNAMEIEYAQKKFAMEPEIRDLLSLTLALDPLAGLTEDDKMTRLSNKGITQITYITSSNIQEFVQRAIAESEGFVDKGIEEQKDVIAGYAAEVETSLNKGKQIINATILANNLTDNPVGGQVPANNTGQPAASAAGDPGQAA